MKKKLLMSLALGGMLVGLSTNAIAHQDVAQPATTAPSSTSISSATSTSAAPLSTDEIAFAAKLSDQMRRVFSREFTSEERKAAMMCSCQGTSSCADAQSDGAVTALSPNQAVEKIMTEGVAIQKKEANAHLTEKVQGSAQPR
jgi:hypothetical protein